MNLGLLGLTLGIDKNPFLNESLGFINWFVINFVLNLLKHYIALGFIRGLYLFKRLRCCSGQPLHILHGSGLQLRFSNDCLFLVQVLESSPFSRSHARFFNRFKQRIVTSNNSLFSNLLLCGEHSVKNLFDFWSQVYF